MLHIKVVGTGCPTCQRLERMCREVTEENQFNATIEKVTDLNRFADLGIFMTPGLIINDEVVSSGKMPDRNTLKNWIEKRSSP